MSTSTRHTVSIHYPSGERLEWSCGDLLTPIPDYMRKAMQLATCSPLTEGWRAIYYWTGVYQDSAIHGQFTLAGKISKENS